MRAAATGVGSGASLRRDAVAHIPADADGVPLAPALLDQLDRLAQELRLEPMGVRSARPT